MPTNAPRFTDPDSHVIVASVAWVPTTSGEPVRVGIGNSTLPAVAASGLSLKAGMTVTVIRFGGVSSQLLVTGIVPDQPDPDSSGG